MPEKSTQSKAAPLLQTGSPKTVFSFYGKMLDAARLQMDRNYRTLGEAGEFVRGNSETAAAVVCTAAEGYAALAESAAEISRRLIDNGLEVSRTLFDAEVVRGLTNTEGTIARSFFTTVNAQLAGFNEALMHTTEGLVEPLHDSISAVASQVEATTH